MPESHDAEMTNGIRGRRRKFLALAFATSSANLLAVGDKVRLHIWPLPSVFDL